MKINADAMRPGQRMAVDLIRHRVSRGERYTAIVIPTRYGKSDIARVASLALKDEGLISCTLALSPNVALMGQLADATEWNKALSRYSIELAQQPDVLQMRKVPVRPNANGEAFLSATMQLVEENLSRRTQGDLTDWVESEHHRTGLPVLVIVDECHTGSEDNKWGNAVSRLVDAGAHAVLLTATAERSDGKRIPGFEFDELDVEEVKVYKTSTSDRGSEYIRVSLYEGQRKRLQLRADLEISFNEAWTESALCKISRTPFDVDLLDDQRNHVAWLSELSPTEAKRELGRAVRRADTISEGCKRFVNDIVRRRRFQPDAAGIVYCGNDNDQDDGRGADRHAKQIQKEIKQLGPELDTRIVTVAQTEDGAEMLREFRNGRYDVIIVKQMAGVGLDVPRAKTGLDLSPTRTYASQVQRMMRPATPYNGILVATWITPDDVLSRAIFEKLVRGQGGEATIMDLEKIDEWDKEREEGPGGSTPLFASGTRLADFQDSDGNEAAADQWVVVDAVLAALPAIQREYSHSEIAFRVASMGLTVAPQSANTVRDVAASCAARQANANGLMTEYVGAVMKRDKIPYARYGEVIQDAWVSAKRAAGWPNPALSLDRQSNLDMLEALVSALEQMLTRTGCEAGLW